MRRRKLAIAVVLLLTWATTAAQNGWNEQPFEEPIHTNKTLVRWNETCTHVPKCALVYLKENVDEPIELLRFNIDTKPIFWQMLNNIIGLEVAEDDERLKYFLQANYPGDYEGSTTTFRAQFYQNSPRYTAIIMLENVNDNEPVIQAPMDCEVMEGVVGPTNCSFLVNDIDGSACYTKMSSTDSKFSFKLEGDPEEECKSATFMLYVDEALDFETYRLHSMTIMAQDVGQVGPSTFLEPKVVFDVSLFFVVNVGDKPDMDPRWTKMTPSIQVDELKEQTEQFIAIDGDVKLNWTIKYHIETKYEEYFSIDEDTGLLTIGAINRDENQEDVYYLVIYATEVAEAPWPSSDARSISSDIVVVVKDINNNMPEFEAHFPDVIEVDEGVYFSEQLFTITDPDLAENGTFSIDFVKNNYSSNFMIVPTTGYQSSRITVASIDASVLDYEDELWREITLKFVATESANSSHQGFADVKIILNDLNDEPPIFEKAQYTPSVPENQPIDALIATVRATDKDAGDIVEYFMRNNSVSNILRVDSSTGEIYTKSKAFDYERQTELVVQIYAQDTADPPHQASCEVLISITNINDEKPVLELPFEAVEIPEHSEVGTRVSKEISATDPDLELANLAYFVNWTATQAYKNGVLVQSPLDYEGVLVLEEVQREDYVWKTYLIINDMDRFDWEKFESLRVNIVVNDTATDINYEHNLMQNGYVTVNVIDINDCAPVFTEDSDTDVDVVENSTSYRLVGAVRATDDDSAPNANITYLIRPLSPEGLEANQLQLVVDNKTGQLYTSGVEFDCEQFDEMEYVYVITASDGDPDHDAHHNITVKVEDVNDNAPTYKEPTPPEILNPKIYEEQEGPQRIACLNADDIDRTKPFNVITYFMENEELFEMRNNCVVAYNGALLDREGKDGERRQMTVYTRDNHENGNKYNSNEGDKVVINLTLLDINDNHPQLSNEEPRSWMETETKADMLLFSVKVEDPDNGNNGTIECMWLDVEIEFPLNRLSSEVKDLFDLKTDEKESTCNIFLNDELIWGDYVINLHVSDKGDPVRLENNQTYNQKIANFNKRRPIIQTPEAGKIFRIYRDVISENDEPLVDIYGNVIEDFEVTDEDDPRTPNGKVNLKLIGSGDIFTVKQTSNDSQTSGPSKFRLLKINSPIPDERTLKITLEASDRTSSPYTLTSAPVIITVYFIDSNAIPEFREREFKTQFTENSTGLTQTREILEAVNEVEQLLEEEDRRDIYYYIIGGDERFQLDKDKRILSLKDELDYEVDTEHKLLVFATHQNTTPVNPPTNTSSVLLVIVEVEDENDMPPEFSLPTYYGVFRVDDDPSKKEPVVTLNATDVDEDESIKYAYIPDSMVTNSPSLSPLVGENIFKVDEISGEIFLNFSPSGKDLSGYFQFQVVAYDKAGDIPGHRDEAVVRVYVVSEKHQVVFNFFDEVEHVEAKRQEICPALTGILTYSCSIEKVSVAKDESKDKGALSDVYTHFIDDSEKSPVDASAVASMFLEGDTYGQLTRAMSELQLALVSFSSPTSPEEDSMAMTIVLAAVCAVLAVLVIVFSLAFVVRTRTLNQRLEKLTMKKFGSQDSGLNRETLAVPGTNRHALEGSNPVWNHEIDPNFDAQSQISGDSDLIGIEDSPEFGGSGQTNPAFERDVNILESSPPTYENSINRRTSINPLAAQAEASDDPYGFSEALGGDMDVPRRFSINPLAGGGRTDLNFDVSDEEPNAEDVDNAYFNTFHSHTSEPSTEL